MRISFGPTRDTGQLFEEFRTEPCDKYELHHFIHAKHNYQAPPLQKKTTTLKSDKYKIINLLEPYPVHIDVLIEKSKTDSSKITSQLLDLELEGHVIRHQGDYYSIPEESH